MPRWPIAHHHEHAVLRAEVSAAVTDADIAELARRRHGKEDVRNRRRFRNEIPKHVAIRIDGILILEAIRSKRTNRNDTAHRICAVIEARANTVGRSIRIAGTRIGGRQSELRIAHRKLAVTRTRQTIIHHRIELERALNVTEALLKSLRFSPARILRKLAKHHAAKHRQHNQDKADLDQRECGSRNRKKGQQGKQYNSASDFQQSESAGTLRPKAAK